MTAYKEHGYCNIHVLFGYYVLRTVFSQLLRWTHTPRDLLPLQQRTLFLC